MKDKFLMNEEELENVSGGAYRTVNNGQSLDAIVRSGPDLNYPQIGSLKDGTQVNTTGTVACNGLDGIFWYEINYPIYGWMKGEYLGYY